MIKLKEATEEDITLAKIRSIRSIVGDEADKFDLDNMNPEDLDQLFAELNKAAVNESIDFTLKNCSRFGEKFTISTLVKNYELKESEAKYIYDDFLMHECNCENCDKESCKHSSKEGK